MAVPVTTLDQARGETAHQTPHFLPDGRYFMYFAATARPTEQGILLGGVESETRKWIAPADSGAVYAVPGYLLFLRGHMLLAVPFETSRNAVIGEPTVVERKVHSSGGLSWPFFSVSANGVLVFHTRYVVQSQLVWFDRRGTLLQPASPRGTYRDPAISSDGRWVVANQLDSEDELLRLWLLDTVRGTSSVLTNSLPRSMHPVFSGDDKDLVFAMNQPPLSTIYRMPLQGSTPTILFQSPQAVLQPTDWSKDGRTIVYGSSDWDVSSDIWMVSAQGNDSPVAFLRTRFGERQARFSPDGRWMAYSSDESGTDQVYVRSLTRSLETKWQISTDGGMQPSWRGDGRELFYLSRARQLVSVTVEQTDGILQPGVPRVLFELPQGVILGSRNGYAATSDGQRFILNIEQRDYRPLSMFATLIVNWIETISRSKHQT